MTNQGLSAHCQLLTTWHRGGRRDQPRPRRSAPDKERPGRLPGSRGRGWGGRAETPELHQEAGGTGLPGPRPEEAFVWLPRVFSAQSVRPSLGSEAAGPLSRWVTQPRCPREKQQLIPKDATRAGHSAGPDPPLCPVPSSASPAPSPPHPGPES